MAAPSIRLMTAVATFWDSGAVVLNGYTTAITVASPMIQVKNIRARGVVSRSRCMTAVAASAAAAAAIAYPAVDASPHAPSWRGARMGMLNSHRHIKMPASAINAATTAVAAPPDHSCLASTVRPGELLRSEGGSSCLDMAQAAFFFRLSRPDRAQGLLGAAQLGALHQHPDPGDQVEQAEQQREGDRADAGAGAQHHAERDGEQAAQDEHGPGPGRLAGGEGGGELHQAGGDRPHAHDQDQDQRGRP